MTLEEVDRIVVSLMNFLHVRGWAAHDPERILRRVHDEVTRSLDTARWEIVSHLLRYEEEATLTARGELKDSDGRLIRMTTRDKQLARTEYKRIHAAIEHLRKAEDA